MQSPPSWATRFVARDLDLVRQLMDPYGSTRRQCVGRGVFEVRASLTRFDDTMIGWYDSRLGQRVHAIGNAPVLHIPLRRPITYRMGGRHLEATPDRAVFVGPRSEFTVCYPGESPILSIVLEEKALKAAKWPLEAVMDAPSLPGGRELALDDGALGRLSHELQSLWSPSPLSPGGPAGGAHIAQRLTAWVAGLLRRGEGSPSAVRRTRVDLHAVEEWIESHLGDPIELPTLCHVAGIEARGLRKSFQLRRGMSPMQWVFSRRMAAARLRLLSAAPGDSVTSVALDCGILHPGRFSVAYRQRYGESPSDTLALAVARD
jgi:AraC-like DNA-binding protein